MATTEQHDRVKIEGVAGFDGEYEVDQAAFTMGDLRLIKSIAGVRAGELDEALRAGDVDVLVAITIIALRRSGHPHWQAFDNAINEAAIDPPPLTYIGSSSEEDGDEGNPQTPPQEPGD